MRETRRSSRNQIEIYYPYYKPVLQYEGRPGAAAVLSRSTIFSCR
jgi:hypothetical protein